MRVLLDTHVLLWWLADDPHLSAAHRTIIGDSNNEVFVSAVPIAEIAIKASLGKLDAPNDVVTIVQQGGFCELALTSAHADALRDLPWLHRDPFDRMLIAQCIQERIPLVTADARIRNYEIDTL
jgi:PIN domain nuclease of toxin-antitoxin system